MSPNYKLFLLLISELIIVFNATNVEAAEITYGYAPSVYTEELGDRSLSFGGSLKNSDGTLFNGNSSLVFDLYNAPVGGVPIYSETQNLNITDGNISTQIGNNQPLNGVFDSLSPENAYLGVLVDGVAGDTRIPLNVPSGYVTTSTAVAVPFEPKSTLGLILLGSLWGGSRFYKKLIAK